MNISNYLPINNILVIASLGVVSYLAYRVISYLLNKSGSTAKTDKLGQSMLLQNPKSATDPVNRPLSPGKVNPTSPQSSKAPIPSPIVPQAIPSAVITITQDPASPVIPIIGKKETIHSYIENEYKGNTPSAQKYSKRLQSLSQFFNKEGIYPVRGDGNCFCNAVVVGLLDLMAKDPQRKQAIIAILKKTSEKQFPYVQPDNTSTAQVYSKNFSKEYDFHFVIKHLEKEQTPLNLLDNFAFAASFSRMIRYMLLCHIKETDSFIEVAERSGEEIDMNAIVLLNTILNLNACLAVLQVSNNAQVDSNQSEMCCLISGKDVFPPSPFKILKRKPKKLHHQILS